MSALLTLVRKEASEMLREKRLPVFALIYTLLSGLITTFVLGDAAKSADLTTGTVPPSALAIAVPLFFLNTLGLVLLAATFVLDSVGKERDAGMLGLILTTPASPPVLLASKLVVAALAYVLAAGLGILMGAILGTSLGSVVPYAITIGFLGPLLVLYVFLVGSGLLLSVLASSARLSIALGVGLYLPLFLMGGTPIFAALFAAAPIVRTVVSYTPFAAASDGINVIVTGGQTPWTAYLITIGVGIACLLAAFAVFQRQEVARG